VQTLRLGANIALTPRLRANRANPNQCLLVARITGLRSQSYAQPLNFQPQRLKSRYFNCSQKLFLKKYFFSDQDKNFFCKTFSRHNATQKLIKSVTKPYLRTCFYEKYQTSFLYKEFLKGLLFKAHNFLKLDQVFLVSIVQHFFVLL
jgi:hypothetical protein